MAWTDHWLSRSLLSRALWVLLAAAAGAAMAYLKAHDSLLSAPVLYGLATFFLVLACAACFLWITSLSKRLNSGISPARAKKAIRDWLDVAGFEVRSLEPLNGQLFQYVVTVNGRRISVRQESRVPRYLYFRASIIFTPEDNQALENTSGGIDSVVRDLRIGLASHRTGYIGISYPLKEVFVTKEMFIADDFNEYQFMQALYGIEGALVLVMEITRPPIANCPALPQAPA